MSIASGQSTRTPSNHHIWTNLSDALAESIKDQETSRPWEERLRELIHGLNLKKCHPSRPISLEDWTYTLRLYQLIKGYCDDSSVYDFPLPSIYETVTERLRETVQWNIDLLPDRRLGDPVESQIILGILSLSLSERVDFKLPHCSETVGTLESFRHCVDNMVEIFIQIPDSRGVTIKERLERIPFLWTGERGQTKMGITVTDLVLPHYWFTKPTLNPMLSDSEDSESADGQEIPLETS
jgi:hypothetical protein